MKSFCRITLFLCVVIVFYDNVSGYCNVKFNPSECAYNVFCRDELAFREKLSHFSQGYIDHSMVTTNCKLFRIPDYSNNYEFYPLYLIYTKSDLMTTRNVVIPELVPNEDERFLNLITSIDLSDNNLEMFPELKKMENLIILDLSKNSLTVAKLSNTYELTSLVEINLSYNAINEIITYESDYIYKGLKTIDLSNNNLTKISEGIFDPFDELESLDISHNNIDALSPYTFDGMKHLIYLDISFNKITDINSSLDRFNELKTLNLSNNKLIAVKASDYNRLTNLETLYLNSNLLSIIEKESFQNMHLLNSLYLNNNKLETVDNEMLTNVSLLGNIDLSDNNIIKIPRGLFRGKNVRHFSIKDNRLKGSIEKGTFEGLLFVNKLDLSNQHLDSITDFAFSGLDNLEILLLNNNNIKIMTKKCFRAMHTLTQLDLSFNKIENVDFEKDDLYNLLSLSLRNNHLTVVSHENFHGLNSLQILDLSHNQILQVESNSFKSLKDLINFEISNNPLSGTLEGNTFNGLNSLPSLDLSCSLLSTIQNGTFIGMVRLRSLNVSHSNINAIKYNVFIHTGVIETIDLSFNKLEQFNINNTELAWLHTLYLNNNQIKILDSATFTNIPRLSKLLLSSNMIQNIYENTFTNQKYLRILDISFNSNLKLTLSLLKEAKNVDILNLSGIKTGVPFNTVKDMSLSQLIMSNSSVSDVNALRVNELRHLDTLSLNNNVIFKLETGGFNNLSTLRVLDLSHNKITFIQPGVFKDNTMLVTMNISHNLLTAISYGIFHGLKNLNTLDVSFNKLTDLKNERFNEVTSLSVLIADHNNIASIDADEFGPNLYQLSIGGNPIPCEVLANAKRNNNHLHITARSLYENHYENIHGVSCNVDTFDQITNVSTLTTADNVKILLNIRDIMLDHFNNHENSKATKNGNEKYLETISDLIQASNEDENKRFLNYTTRVLAKNDETNSLLNKILNVLTLNSATRPPPIQVTKDNATYENLLTYINKVRQQLELDMKLAKDSILNEVEAKITAANAQVNRNNLLLPTEIPKYEKLSSSADSKSLFTETCVAMILVILVGFVLFKVYKSGIFLRQRFSVSTRELPGAMDSAL